MSDACTIYATKIDYNSIYATVKAMSSYPIQVIGNVDKWQEIKIYGRSNFTFTSMESRPGEFDDFSKLVLGTYAFFQHIKTINVSNRDKVLNFISECQFAIGVVADPSFDEDEKHYDMVFAITEALGGLIFNGSGMINQDGLLVLDSEGNSDLTYA